MMSCRVRRLACTAWLAAESIAARAVELYQRRSLELEQLKIELGFMISCRACLWIELARVVSNLKPELEFNSLVALYL